MNNIKTNLSTLDICGLIFTKTSDFHESGHCHRDAPSFEHSYSKLPVLTHLLQLHSVP